MTFPSMMSMRGGVLPSPSHRTLLSATPRISSILSSSTTSSSPLLLRHVRSLSRQCQCTSPLILNTRPSTSSNYDLHSNRHIGRHLESKGPFLSSAYNLVSLRNYSASEQRYKGNAPKRVNMGIFLEKKRKVSGEISYNYS